MGAKGSMMIILHSGDYDKIHHALSIALAAADGEMQCHIFVAYDALRKFTKAQIDSVPVGSTFSRQLMPLIAKGKETGNLRLYVCASSMSVMGLRREEMIDEFDEFLGLSSFLAMTNNANLSFFI
ncbi:MAG: DsrE/DsrF/DrsH-like family protein [Nitrososphaerales archaeon]